VASNTRSCFHFVYAIFFAALFLTSCPTGFALQATTPQNPSGAGYPVVMDGHLLVEIYEGLGTFSAQERARRGSERFSALALSDRSVDSVTTEDEPYGTEIVLGDDVLMVVTDADAAHTGLPRQLLAKQLASRLRELVAQIRVERSTRYLWISIVKAVGTLIAYAIAIWLVIVGIGGLLRKIASFAQAHLKGIKIQQAEILTRERVARIISTVLQLVRVVLVFTLCYLLLASEFSYFPYTRAHGKILLGYVTSPLGYVGHGLLAYLPNLAYIVIILTVVTYVMKFMRLVARAAEQGKIRIPGFYPEWVDPTYKILRFLLFAFTLVIIFPYLPGSQSPAFKGIGIFLGVLFSLGSTSAVSNVVAGTILTYTRGFRTGDWVEIGDNIGEVKTQSLLATHLRTIRNEEITIPSSVVLSSHVINYSRLANTKGLILHTSVTIGYDAPWRTIHQLLIDAALKTKYILSNPAPFVLQKALDDSYVEYEINAYTEHPLEMIYIYSDLRANIQDSFYAAGVEIMSPVYSALRDGNKKAIPSQFLPKDYHPQSFRIAKDDSAAAAGGKG
jgi:small-conductance mechanosensitive channel